MNPVQQINKRFPSPSLTQLPITLQAHVKLIASPVPLELKLHKTALVPVFGFAHHAQADSPSPLLLTKQRVSLRQTRLRKRKPHLRSSHYTIFLKDIVILKPCLIQSYNSIHYSQIPPKPDVCCPSQPSFLYKPSRNPCTGY